MASIKVILSQRLPIKWPIHNSMVSTDIIGVALGIIQAWWTKITSHMVMAELLIQITIDSLMHNGKMEIYMDTVDGLINLVTAGNQNGKMVSR